jgi:lambda family phage portal protein
MAPKSDNVSARPSTRTARREAKTAEQAHQKIMRGFDAGKSGRRLRAIPATGTAINTLIRSYGKSALARSRYLTTNNPYASAAKAAFTSSLVGAGIKPSSLATDPAVREAVNAAWLASADEFDADGLYDIYGLQTLVADELFEAGEVFIRFRERRPTDGLLVPLQLQILPSEMVPTEYNVTLPNRNTVNMGVEFDGIGRRVAYHVFKRHPGELWNGMNIDARELVRIPASEIMHVFKPIRAGQVRGTPNTMPGLVSAAITDLYEDAELERKRTAALFGAFTTRTEPAGADEDVEVFEGATTTENDDGTLNFTLEPGVTVDLPQGRDIKFAEPADVGSTYEPFLFRQLSRMAAGFGVPYVDMTGDLRQVNYSSDRSGLVRFRRKMEAMQHNIIAFQFLRVVWARWFTAAVRAQAIKGVTATKFVEARADVAKVKWIAPKWDWVDPLKDRQAEKLAVDSGFKSRSDVIEAEGYDAEEVDARIAADQARATELGIEFVQLPSSVIVAPGEESTIMDDASTPPVGTADENEFG